MLLSRKRRLITIGSFDGVHFGHQALLKKTKAEAKARRCKSLVLTFDQPPKFLLHQKNKFAVLSTPLEKRVLLKQMGIHEIKPLPSKKKFFSTQPFRFFRDVLIRQMGAKGLVVGLDFRFGRDRSAGALELVRWGVQFGIPVWVIHPVKKNKRVVSSSLLRKFLEEGRYKKARPLLGHSYLVSGPVRKGRGVGRKLGFPTANISVPKEKIVPPGVYAVKGWINPKPNGILPKAGPLPGVVNVGRRPTFLAHGARTVEAHFLKGKGSLRGKTLLLEFIGKIRDEKKFASPQALQKAIAADIQKAKVLLKKNGSRNRLVF